jgi:hypothetical protein
MNRFRERNNRRVAGREMDNSNSWGGRNNSKLPAVAMPVMKRQSGNRSGGILDGGVNSFSLFELIL